eukprot:c11450_g1_i1.p1 GENE.c11450_g1_i1~~c11450_g1_i1.p1  ORF type:complete len:390 (+),score=70.40 c11450_g1_i1:330-1499(+)
MKRRIEQVTELNRREALTQSRGKTYSYARDPLQHMIIRYRNQESQKVRTPKLATTLSHITPPSKHRDSTAPKSSSSIPPLDLNRKKVTPPNKPTKRPSASGDQSPLSKRRRTSPTLMSPNSAPQTPIVEPTSPLQVSSPPQDDGTTRSTPEPMDVEIIQKTPKVRAINHVKSVPCMNPHCCTRTRQSLLDELGFCKQCQTIDLRLKMNIVSERRMQELLGKTDARKSAGSWRAVPMEDDNNLKIAEVVEEATSPTPATPCYSPPQEPLTEMSEAFGSVPALPPSTLSATKKGSGDPMRMCEFCGKKFNKMGIGRHRSRCQIKKQPEDDDQDYEVEEILEHCDEDGLRFYLVRFLGYDDTWNMWLPAENLESCDRLLAKYQQRCGARIEE